jgi:hypothetical protein
MRLTLAVIVIAIAGAIGLTMMTDVPDSQLRLGDVKTTSIWHSLVPERFIGCPNLMHSSQDPVPFGVETLQSPSFEFLKIEIQRDALQRDHVATTHHPGTKPCPPFCDGQRIAPGPIEHRPCPVFWPFCGEQIAPGNKPGLPACAPFCDEQIRRFAPRHTDHPCPPFCSG